MLEANEANTEIFMNAALIWVFALLVRAEKRLLTGREAIVVGLLAVLSTLYKPVVVVIPGMLLAVYVVFPPGGATQRRGALANALTVAGIIAAVWLLIAAFFAAQGQFAAFYYAMVTYNRTYSGSLLHNVGLGLTRKLVNRHMLFLLPLLGSTVVLGGIRIRQQGDRRWLLFMAYCLGTVIAVALPGRFYPHYYQLWLPVVACGFGWMVDAIRQWRRPQTVRFAAAVASLALLFCCGIEAYSYRLTSVEWSYQKYGKGFVDTEKLAHALNEVLLPNETIYDACVEPELYLLTRRRPISGIFYSVPMWAGPEAEVNMRRVLNDLNHHPPDLVVMRRGADQYALSTSFEDTSYMVPPTIMQWINQHYARAPQLNAFRGFVVFARRDSPIEARLSSHQ